jgi:hypothetical protein
MRVSSCKPPRHLIIVIFVWALIFCPVLARSQELRSLGAVFDSAAQQLPFSFPAKIVVNPSGNIYIPDTELSNIFLLNSRGRNPSRLCTQRMPVSLSDISVDARGNILVLESVSSKVVRLNQNCEIQSSFECRKNDPLKLQVNAFGEIIILNGFGDKLFDMYSADGKFLRSFGERIRYGDSDTDRVLSNGNLVADRNGGLYFSFNYPPMIRHYARNGSLISEIRPDSDVKIDPPHVSVRRYAGGATVSSRYQILVLDMAAGHANRLYLLISGKNHAQARLEGSKQLLVTTATGKVLKKIALDDNFHRLAVGGGALYLLKNRGSLRLKKYALP